jgi:short-subunit dehydrogenase
MAKGFENKIVFITGSSQGIGKATAELFLSKGAHVILNGRNEERLNQAISELSKMGRVSGIAGDISNIERAAKMMGEIKGVHGRLDVLVNNAGVSMRGDFAELHPEVYRTVFETNVQGVVNLSIPAMELLRESRGSLVLVSSLAGIRGLPGLSAYCSSKMALRGIAESIRIEESASGVHVGLVQVGITEIEHDKQTVSADGSLITINDRSKFKVSSKESVAKAILRNVERRRFVSTLTPIGKLNSAMQSIAPGLVEWILIKSIKRIKERS